MVAQEPMTPPWPPPAAGCRGTVSEEAWQAMLPYARMISFRFEGTLSVLAFLRSTPLARSRF